MTHIPFVIYHLNQLLLRYLSLILWGATIMVFVDHVMGFIMEGGEFLEVSADAIIVGFIMLATALALWEITLLIKDPKKVWREAALKASNVS